LGKLFRPIQLKNHLEEKTKMTKSDLKQAAGLYSPDMRWRIYTGSVQCLAVDRHILWGDPVFARCKILH
jgi:hypothetical protein